MCGLIRRYGSAEPIVVAALLRLLATCAGINGPVLATAVGAHGG